MKLNTNNLDFFETLKSYDKNIASVSNLIRTLKIYPTAFEDEEFHELHKFFDKALFIALNQMDLIIGLKYLDISQAIGNNLEANYFARVLVLSCHEILNDLNKMGGIKIRDELTKKLGVEKLKELDEVTIEMNFMRKKYLKELKLLRNKVLGHKHEEAHQQAELIVNIDTLEIYNIGNSIYTIQMKYIHSYVNLLEKI